MEEQALGEHLRLATLRKEMPTYLLDAVNRRCQEVRTLLR